MPNLRHDGDMATSQKQSSGRTPKAGGMVTGRSVVVLGRGMELVKVGRSSKPTVRRGDNATALVQKVAKALKKPGIDKSVVFRGPNPEKVYAYSAYPQDPTRIVRISSNGTRVVGRMVSGKFRPSK